MVYSHKLGKEVDTLTCIECGKRGKICEGCHCCRYDCQCKTGQCANAGCSKAGFFQVKKKHEGFRCSACGGELQQSDTF